MNVSLNDSFRMLPRLVPALVCLAMLGAGCGQQKVPPRQQEADRQALAADSLHMARLYADWRQRVRSQGQQRHGEYVQMPLDLSEDAQYRFVNVARWDSLEHFQAAHATEEFRRVVTADGWDEFQSRPALYEVIVADDAEPAHASS